jgi:uncharacterized membrane protein YeaQ/YmgE (transglycosylase-associated protein family)
MELLDHTALGFAAGALASLFMRTRSAKALLMDSILGAFGALGGVIGKYMIEQPEQLAGMNPYSITLIVIGAITWMSLGKLLKFYPSDAP